MSAFFRRGWPARTAGLLALSAVLVSPSWAQTAMPLRNQYAAHGSFTVQMKPAQAEADFGDGNAKLARMTLDKAFEGDLVAQGHGEMLTAMTQTRGSAGYVALERVTGSLQGRKGSFVLQHSGVMDQGAQSLSITVVPDSGSGDLIGLQGSLQIRIEAGKHFYDFEYSLPDLVK